MISKLLHSKNIRNSFWSILEVTISPLLFFVSTPFFFQYLEEEIFGAWMLINSIIIIMQALNLGLNNSTYKHLSEAIKNKNWKAGKESLNTNISLTILLSGLAIMLLFGLQFGMDKYNWFIEANDSKRLIIMIIPIGGIIIFVKFCEQIFYNVFRAFEEFQYVTYFGISVKTVTIISNLLLAYYTQDLRLIFINIALIGCLGIFISYAFLKKKIPQYSFTFSVKKIAIKKEISFALITWLQSILVIAAYQGDKLFVSHQFGLITLSYYSIISTLFNHIHLGLTSLTPWMFPQIVKSKGLGEEYIFHLYKNIRNIGLVIGLSLLLVFSWISEPLLSFWLGQDKFIELETPLQWFTVLQFFLIYSIAPFFYLNASGKERLALKSTFVFTGLTILGYVGGYYYFESLKASLIGMASGTALGMITMHFSIEKDRSIKGFYQTILLFLPAVFGAISVIQTGSIKTLWILLFFISLYSIFFKVQRTSFKTLIG